MSMGSDREWLAERVLDVDGWLRGLPTTEVIMSDQIPYWVKIGREKQAYTQTELLTGRGRRGEKHLERHPGMSQKIGRADVEGEAVPQTRQRGDADAEKFRVTYEAAQCLSNLWSDGGELSVRQLKPVLVFPGAYARLSNIGEDGCFRKTERFVVKRKEIVRPQGSKAGSLMSGWRQLRDHGTDFEKELVNKFDIYQQPAGFCDGVIVSWTAEARAAEVPQCLHVRDAFAAGWAESSMRANFLCQSLQVMIAGKMTPVMQLTDTDVSAVMKRASELKKKEILGENRERAQALGCKNPEVRCSKVDMLRICLAGHERVEKLNAETKNLLAGLRRNGFLRWKPDVNKKRLVRIDEVYPKMKQNMPERSHRVPESWWRRRDDKGFDGGKRPEVPPLKELGRRLKKDDDMIDMFPAQEPDELTKLHAWDEHKMKNEGHPEIQLDLEPSCEDELSALRPAALSLAVKARDAARVESILNRSERPKHLKCEMKGAKMKKMKARCKRRLMRKLRKRNIKDWRAEAVSYLGRYSRAQLLSALVPEALMKPNKRLVKKAEDSLFLGVSNGFQWVSQGPLDF